MATSEFDRAAVDSEEQRDEADAVESAESTWFAEQLGDAWQAQEPGIYRYVGPASGEDPDSES